MKNKILYIYSGGSRKKLIREVQEGASPDTMLYGFNHFKDAEFIESKGRWADLFFMSRLFYIASFEFVISPVAIPVLLVFSFIPFIKTKWIVFNINLVHTLNRKKDGFKKKLLIRVLNHSHRILCLSNFQKEALIRHGVSEEKLEFVYFGVDSTYHDSVYCGGEVILSVGKDKGRDYKNFLGAISGLDNVSIVTSKRNLEGLNVPRDVSTYFDISNSELKKLYQKAKMVVVTLNKDGGSDCSGQTVVLDAMSNGIPVIVSDRKWVRDYGLGGIVKVVSPGDPSGLRKEIDILNSDIELRKRMSILGRKKVLSCYNTTHMADHIKKYL
ncbi:MAG: glycosyltransferase family 4 protein [Candidatus Pacebacteria bacterium]|nr:glycosyltransferase family 4 protein [Candidatus Paceibacterota bacterium]